VVAERRNTESVSQHELQILRETQLQLSSTGNGSAVQEGLRLREGTNECVDRGLFTPGISYDDLKNERKSEVHHAELRRHYHWHGTVSKQILGASFLGLEGDEVIHCVLDIVYAKAPYTVIQRAMHIHPTVSEFIPTMMDQLKPLQ
jgi:hypothetical protein